MALTAAVALALATAESARWDPITLLVVAALTTISDLTSVETQASVIRISGSFLGLMLAAVLLGGAPAAMIGVISVAFGWLRTREDARYLLNNVVTYAWFPLLAGVCFHAVTKTAPLGPSDGSYYLAVFGMFLLALGLNFAMIAAYTRYRDGTTIKQQASDVLVPVLSSELFSGLLTTVAVYTAWQLGRTGLVLFALVLVVFQYLVGELLASKRRSVELHRMATIDELTGLANRELFQERLAQEIARCKEHQAAFGVMLLDLDRFKEINDTLGHDYGDRLLGDLGPRLAECVQPTGLVARLGGDEFAVLPGVCTDDPKILDTIARRLLACVQHPFTTQELSLEVGGSVGIARYPRDGTDAHTLLRRADIAMYAAKEAQSGARLYAAEQDTHSIERLGVIGDFRRALGAGEIVLHYQPIIDLDHLKLHGAEALVRWQHPERGTIPPGAFIHTVEQTGMIGALTHYVLERAIEQCAEWHAAGQPLSVAVNLSVRNLVDRKLPSEVERLLALHGLPPRALELEITESMIMSDPDRALSTIAALSGLGVRFAIDDFGTGYSSLAYLSRLPIDELKIDRSFVSPMLRDTSDLIIVRSTINLAHDLGLAIIAEGVEDAPTLDRLGEMGCDRVQGFHLGRPMPAEVFAEWTMPDPSAGWRTAA